MNRSPYTRRVAITLQLYGVLYEVRPSSGFRAASMRASFS
jgi:hypothetical protein